MDQQGLAADQVAPPLPQTMVLNMTDPLTPGQPVQIQVTGATANSSIYLVRSNGQIGAGQCPPQLAGGCLGITPGGSGYQLLPLRTNAAGTAQISVPLPANLPLGMRLVFQAVDVNGPKGSNTLERTTASNCTDDGFEDNDDPTQATVGAGLYPAQANACDMDDDCWGATVQPGDMGTFTVTYDSAGDGDVDIMLFDAAGTVIDASASAGDVDEVSYFNNTASPARVAMCASLYSDNGAPSGSIYEVDYAASTPAACTADALEPNDTSAAARARTPGSTPNLTACMGDRWDWYTVQANSGQIVTVTANHMFADADIDLYAVAQAGPNDTAVLFTNSLDTDTGTVDNAMVTFTAPSTGTYWIAVYTYGDRGAGPIDGGDYSLDITVQ